MKRDHVVSAAIAMLLLGVSCRDTSTPKTPDAPAAETAVKETVAKPPLRGWLTWRGPDQAGTSMVKGLRLWHQGKNPAVTPHLAEWAKRGASADLRDNLTQPQEEFSASPPDKMAPDSLSPFEQVNDHTSLELLMGIFTPTAAEQAAIERRLAGNPLSGPERNALHRWMLKARSEAKPEG